MFFVVCKKRRKQKINAKEFRSSGILIVWRSSMESRLQKKEMNTSDRKRTGRPLFPYTVNLIFKSASVLRYGYIVLSFYGFLISDAREEKFEVQSQLFGGSVGGA